MVKYYYRTRKCRTNAELDAIIPGLSRIWDDLKDEMRAMKLGKNFPRYPTEFTLDDFPTKRYLGKWKGVNAAINLESKKIEKVIALQPGIIPAIDSQSIPENYAYLTMTWWKREQCKMRVQVNPQNLG